LGVSGSTFDGNGTLVLKDGIAGLTCATFVLALFRSAGIALLHEREWPVRREDDLAFLSLVQEVGPPELLERLKREVEN